MSPVCDNPEPTIVHEYPPMFAVDVLLAVKVIWPLPHKPFWFADMRGCWLPKIDTVKLPQRFPMPPTVVLAHLTSAYGLPLRSVPYAIGVADPSLGLRQPAQD